MKKIVDEVASICLSIIIFIYIIIRNIIIFIVSSLFKAGQSAFQKLLAIFLILFFILLFRGYIFKGIMYMIGNT